MVENEVLNFISRKRYMLLMIFGAVILFVMYAQNIHNIYVIWEIPDEGGYLFNASLIANEPWHEVFSNCLSYYGYGYSVLLIPLFFLCNSGKELIQAAILVNVLLVVFNYFLQIYLMKRLFEKLRKELWVFVSFVVSFYPYIVCNAFKVLSEVFLCFQFWLIAVLLYKAVVSDKLLYYLLMMFATAYIFFIHARAIVVVGTMLLLIIYLCMCKKITIKRFLICFGTFILCFGFLYMIKNNIVAILGTGKIALSMQTDVRNLFSGEYFVDRIRWLFMNIIPYFIQAIGKCFYLIVSTLGVVIWGGICAFQRGKSYIKNHGEKGEEKNIVFLFLGSAFLFMFLASCVNGTGDSYIYMLYGRYYEYVVTPMLLLGFGLFFSGEIKEKEILVCLFLTFISGIVSTNLRDYTNSDSIGIDTSRLSGISYAIKNSDGKYIEVIYLLLAVTMVSLFVIMLMIKTQFKNILVLLVLMISFYLTDNENILTINEVNAHAHADLELAEYMIDNWENKEAYFIYEPYKYDDFYQRLQVLVKDYQIHVIFPDEVYSIKERDYIITYKGSDVANELKADKKVEYIMPGTCYELFVK